MLNNLKRTIFAVSIGAVICLCISSKVSAKMLYGRLVTGVGDYGNSRQYYYVTSSALGEESRINESMSMWVNSNGTGVYTPISFRQTTTQKSSIIDFHKGNYYSKEDGTIATTKYYVKSNPVSPYNTNWYWCNIEINSPVFDSLSTFHKTGTVSHEIGHAFGLDHPDELCVSVMPQLRAGRFVNGPKTMDLEEINMKY